MTKPEIPGKVLEKDGGEKLWMTHVFVKEQENEEGCSLCDWKQQEREFDPAVDARHDVCGILFLPLQLLRQLLKD